MVDNLAQAVEFVLIWLAGLVMMIFCAWAVIGALQGGGMFAGKPEARNQNDQ
jgi:hypothetical protein